MKKLLLLTGISAISLAAFAEVSEPLKIENSLITSISPNGKYAVSQTDSGMIIFNLETGDEEFSSFEDEEYMYIEAGQGQCVSNDGIVVASYMSPYPQYWKDGEWHDLQIPENALNSNHAQAITPDGSRICGIIGVAEMSFNDDVLMIAPCVWNAEGDGYGTPVMLPHPDLDYANRVPQYVTAIDISADGKIVVGQIVEASGLLSYPIIYKEDENGEWTYEIIHEDLINPDKLDIVPYPGEGPAQPVYEIFMTPDEIEAYLKALNEYYANYETPYPQYTDFMTPDEIAAYNEAVDEYNKVAEAYNEKLSAWNQFNEAVHASSPDYVFNSIRISSDGKTIGCTVQVIGERDPMSWRQKVENYVWLFDLKTDAITKYAKNDDINLNYLADNGVAIGTTSPGTAANSYILKDGEAIEIESWINSKVPEYASWINENMVFDDILMTGRATATPDLSVISLSVENVWDYMDDGLSCVFNMNEGTGIETIRPSSEEKIIYDLSGRKLKNASAPGIYIINGEKKAVR